MSNFTERIIRAAKLDTRLYEEVESDQTAMTQAMWVVILSGLAAGVGIFEKAGIDGIFIAGIGAIISWFIWAFLTYFIGTRLLPQPQTHTDLGELLRTIGFSSSPGLIRLLAVIPVLKDPIYVIASLWMLIAMVIAVRQALDYTSTWRAAGVCFIGWLVQMVIFVFFYSLFGGPMKAV